jgi:hypothetical protein
LVILAFKNKFVDNFYRKLQYFLSICCTFNVTFKKWYNGTAKKSIFKLGICPERYFA